jgi:hypothetical protein
MSIENNLKHFDMDKYNKLLEISNPLKVIENAIKYLNDPNIIINISSHKNHKYMICNPYTMTKIHFGEMHIIDFTKHNDLEKREEFIRTRDNYRCNSDWKVQKYHTKSLNINLLWNDL